jgi:hypothetical protein
MEGVLTPVAEKTYLPELSRTLLAPDWLPAMI